jgi:DUF1365 family protein
MTGPEHVAGTTFHGRRGAVGNSFRYGVDYVLIDAERPGPLPRLFARNARALTSLHDSDHGGPPGAGRGAAWVREVLARHDLPDPARILLLAQPRVLGHVFNPVSFWLCEDATGALRVVIAEVTNTFGDRHSYLCHRDDLGPIGRSDLIAARKIMHVSPFQPVAGGYSFRFDIAPERIGIWIDYAREDGGLYATLTGRRRPLGTGAIIGAMLHRPFGSRRVLALIHWQALKLFLKGARYRSRPVPPAEEISR